MSSPNGLRHNTHRVCSHSITTIWKHPKWIMELEYFFYRINVDLLSKLLHLVTCENRSPMRGHTFLSFLCFAFPYFSSFFDFPPFLNFPAFHTFLLFLFYPAFWIYAAFSEIFFLSHFWHHFWTLVLTWLLLQVIPPTLSTNLNWWANFSIYST